MADYDIVVLGGGPGGYATALYAASAGLSVALVEANKVGGTCLHRGCIPAKALLHAAEVFRTVNHAGEHGVKLPDGVVPEPDWPAANKRKAGITGQLYKGLSGLLKRRKVNVVNGWGRLTADGAVAVAVEGGGSQTLSGRAVVVCAGSAPRAIPGMEVDQVRVSIGRRPVTEDIGAAEAGVRLTDRGFVEVDPTTMLTSRPGVYAVGDCVNTPGLAHVAYAEGVLAVQHFLGENPVPVDYGKVPWVVYTHPEVAWSGMTEAYAKEAGYDVEVHKHSMAGNGRAMILGETDGLVKVVAQKDGPILGFHMVGPWASELMHEGYLAVNWEALPSEVGHLIAFDDPLFEVSTDKVDSEIPSPYDGVVLEILVAAGETVPIGTPLVRIGEPGSTPGGDGGGPAPSDPAAPAT